MSDGNTNWESYLTVAAVTDLGMRRTNNQDNLCVSLAQNSEQWNKRGHLFIVADGMGAHAAGELASKLAVDQIPLLLSKYRDTTPAERLKRAILEANAEIHRKGQANEEFHHMGTTCSVLTLSPEGALAAHVGDSRVYRFRNLQLEQLTFDHSLVWEMRAAGTLTNQEELSKIPKNVITRSLGPYPDVQVDLEGPFPIQPGDSYLLSSDGLTGQVSDAEIGAILAVLAPAEAVQFLVHLANLRGGPDNTTIILVRVNAPLPNTVEPPPANSTPSDNHKFLYVSATLGAGLLLVSILLLANKLWWAAAPAAIGLLLFLFALIKLTSSSRKVAPVSSALRAGKAPYTQTDCSQTGWELVNDLRNIIQQILEEASNRKWTLEEAELAKLLSAAEKGMQSRDLRSTLRNYALTVSNLMSQLRSQSGGSGNVIDL